MKHLFISIGGILFGFGLAISGMTKPEIVLNFLQLKDLGLLLVLASAAFITMFTINIISKLMKKPLIGEKFDKRVRILNKKTIIGAIIFGVGWGISGLCPGSAISSIGIGNYPILIGVLSMFIGAYVHGLLEGFI